MEKLEGNIIVNEIEKLKKRYKRINTKILALEEEKERDITKIIKLKLKLEIIGGQYSILCNLIENNFSMNFQDENYDKMFK